MKRSTFIKQSSLMAFSVSAFGTIRWNGGRYVGDSPTTTDILGPFYRPGTPIRSNICPPQSKGIPMTLQGMIKKEDGKMPLNNALVEIWQCDENEHYDNTSDEYMFRGAARTGTNGKYAFQTIVPVPYKIYPDRDDLWRPAHIHMRVSVPDQQDLITQIYFQGDKYLNKDEYAAAPEAANRILPITKSQVGNSVTFDVVMSKEFPLDKQVYSKITGIYEMDNGILYEFYMDDDLLFMKKNGQVWAALKYLGNNTFGGVVDDPKVAFELVEKGNTKATIIALDQTIKGEKAFKYR